MKDRQGDFSDAPSLRESERFGLDEPGLVACLSAAKGLGLVLRFGSQLSRFSRFPREAWWGAKSYGASMELGGPWSVEFVYRACELGLISLDPQTANRAMLTKTGRVFLRERLGKVSPSKRKDGSSPPNTEAPND